MPQQLTYPGVYVEELLSGVHTITGVSTSVTAFIGYTISGLANKAQTVLSFSDFERMYGGLSKESPVSYAVQQFFLNGGQNAIVVRIAQGGQPAGVTLISVKPGASPTIAPVLDISAKKPGAWANGMVITIDYDTNEPDSTFNMNVSDPSSGRSESFSNMTMNPNSSRYVLTVVNNTSGLISANLNPALPVPSDSGVSISAPGIDIIKLDKDHCQFMITLNENDGPKPIAIYDGTIANKPADLSKVATSITTEVQKINVEEPYKSFQADYNLTKKILTLTSGEKGPGSFVRVTSAPSLDVARVFQLGAANGGKEIDGAASIRPAPNGTTSGSLDIFPISKKERYIYVKIDDDGPHKVQVSKAADTPPTNVEELRQLIQKEINAIKPTNQGSTSFMGVTSKTVGNTIQILSGSTDPNSVLTIDDNNANGEDPTSADDLMLSPAKASQNVKAYTIGTGKTLGEQSGAMPGDDGKPPLPTDYVGSEADKTGIYALLDVDIFNILCIPGVSDFNTNDAIDILSKAVSFCGVHRAFLIIDPPTSWQNLSDALKNLSDFDPVRSESAAMYFPNIVMADSLNGNASRVFPPCGAVAGIYARTDNNRGVWKAPAGQDATLTGVLSLTYKLTDKENGQLNPLGLNCLRNFPVIGSVVWGARTLKGADVLANEWKYIPVRRTALFLEESLFRGLKWVVFEPNDEPLWSQIRLNAGAFMHNLFVQGAFQGTTPREAYFVKCDKETTTQNDIDNGIVNIIIGFAPLKPAEFVVIKIQQIAGQVQT